MSRLIVVSSDTSIHERIARGADAFPVPLIFSKNIPTHPDPASIILISFPLDRASSLFRLSSHAFIGSGGLDWLSYAFESGALDYLRDPWTLHECVSRVGRFFLRGAFLLAGTTISIKQGRLYGPQGSVALTYRQERILRLLHRYEGHPVSRQTLAHQCGFKDCDQSRSFDVALSRLRLLLADLCDARTCINIKSIRGQGLVLEVLDKTDHSCE